MPYSCRLEYRFGEGQNKMVDTEHRDRDAELTRKPTIG